MQREARSRDLHLARTVLDDDVAVLADSAGLLRISLGRAGVGLRLEVVLLVRHLPSPTPSPCHQKRKRKKRIPRIRSPRFPSSGREGQRGPPLTEESAARRWEGEAGASDAAIRTTRVPHGRSTRVLYAAGAGVAARADRGLHCAAQCGPPRPLFRRDVKL